LDDIYYERTLNRIIQGRLRLRLGDLVLFINEPSLEILEESFEKYDEAYKKAYFSGVYIEQEILELLVENDLWSPIDEKRIKELTDDIENDKVEAFKEFLDKKKLRQIKFRIKQREQQIAEHTWKKNQLDHLSCVGLANFARRSWILSQTTTTEDGSIFNFDKLSLTHVLDIYASNTISNKDIRRIARTDPWRSMWHASKKRALPFGSDSVRMNKDQLNLTSYSSMYDNVYESPDAPSDKIVEDDVCLDGWFIMQRRKREKEKKEQQVNDMLGDGKVANSQEVFLMANSQDKAKEILDLNDPLSRSIIEQRNAAIDNTEGNMHFKELPDMKQERMISAVNSAKTATKRRGK